MKKKGFTLVELLAVIAILAILVIIALPNVLGMFNSAKRNTFKTEVESIYKQAQTDFINDSLQSSGARTYCDAKSAAEVDGSNNALYSCNGGELELTTTKQYYIEMNSKGEVLRFGVKDNSFVYGQGTSGGSSSFGINDIDDTLIKDASKNSGFNLKSGTPTD